MDRRRIKRKRQRIAVKMDPGGVTSVTADLSPGGLFLYSARVLRPGTAVRLVIRLPTGTAEAEGVVRWAKRVPPHLLSHVRGGMGIQFTWLSPELEEYLSGRAVEARSAV